MNTRDQVANAWERHGGNISKIAEDLGVARSTVQYHVGRLNLKPMASGRVAVPEAKRRTLPKKGEIKRYILTSAQNNTHVHPQVWESILAIAAYYDAELLVGTFTYNQNAYGKMSVKQGKYKPKETELWYDEAVRPHIADEAIELAPGLEWRGEMNILPTAVDPLNGFETYTHRKSGIFPQAKFAMRSIASDKNEATKFNYTTGTVTQRNYIQKRAGLRAEHHHGYGGLLVEVDPAGRWFVRQLNCDEDGTLYDLDIVVEDGEVYENEVGVEALTFGDIHALELQEGMMTLIEDMLDKLTPRVMVLHDLLLGGVTNHWESRDPHEKFRRHVRGGGFTNLTQEIQDARAFLEQTARSGTETVVTYSNHDEPWILRWLKSERGMHDPKNAIMWHELNAAVLRSIRDNPEDRATFNCLAYAIDMPSVRFLAEDESFVVADGKIECGMHGHLGPNGTRGSAQNLAKVGRRANIGHSHAAGIWDGLYVAGMSCRLDLGYNTGPSSWSNSHIVTYPNGKRTIITVWDGKWRA